MPTDQRNLAEVMAALLSVGAVTVDEVPAGAADNPRTGYRLSITASVIIDHQHEESVQKVLDP